MFGSRDTAELARLRLRKSERGSVIPMVAIAMPILIGFAGMALEMGSWFAIHERMQNAADSAALAAGRAYVVNNSADLTSQAKATASSYNFTATNGTTVTVNRGPVSGAYAGDSSKIEVIIQQPQSRTFSAIFTGSTVPISARAVASINPTPVCLLALNASAGSALAMSGGAIVSAPTCDVRVNSSSSSALAASGSNTRLTSKDVYVTGAESLLGGATVTVTGTNQSSAAAAADPYSGTAVPAFAGCNQTNYTKSGGTFTISPGVYCGGITISAGTTLTLDPGVYFLDQGSLTVSGGSSISCSACTIILTSSTGSNFGTVNISGGSVVSISAPTTGDTANFAFMGDPRIAAGTTATFTGGSNQNISGVIYMPKNKVVFTGGTSGASDCTKIVADTFTFTGGSTFSGTCSSYPGEEARSPITLAE
jgi:Flp pilus assembly protein TadG